MTTSSWTSRLAIAVAVATLLQVSASGGDERPRTSSTVKAKAQGGGSGGESGSEALAGAPPATPPSLASRKAHGTATARVTKPQAESEGTAIRAVSLSEGEATLEIGGRLEVVRPGSRLGEDVVRSVTPERVVLERSPRPGEDGERASLVIVTFDEAGRGRTRLFLARDPARGEEAKRP